MSSQLVSKIGTKLCAHERRTYVHPGDLLRQLHRQPRQARKPGGFLRLVVKLKPVLRVVFRPIARIRNRYGMLDERMVAGMPAFAATVSLFKDLASLRQ